MHFPSAFMFKVRKKNCGVCSLANRGPSEWRFFRICELYLAPLKKNTYIKLIKDLGLEKISCEDIPSPKKNHLLDVLDKAEYGRLEPHLELHYLALGDILYESGGCLSHVYFPVSSIVSLLYVMENGASAEIAVVGNEGIIGIALFMGGETVPNRAVVQSAGYSYRMRGDNLRQEFNKSGGLQHLLLRYTLSLFAQMAQTAVCNRHHSIDQQLCRWLLLSLDRLPANELCMTQELIANMLGVRREGVTEAAGKLQDAGLIKYNRGKITILDRPGLEARVCECYQVVRKESLRLLPCKATE